MTGRHGDYPVSMAASSFSDAASTAESPINKPTKIMHITSNQSASLEYCEGSSNKVYHTAIEAQGDGFTVTFSYGRRGSTLNTGIKTARPVTFKEAERIFDKLIQSKLSKGYRYSNASAGGAEPETPYLQTGEEGRDTGIRCQLLNAVDEDQVTRLLKDDRYCLQEKHDGRRLMVRKQGDEITGINRRGLITSIPTTIREAVSKLPVDVLLDGEACGDVYHVFDLLEVKGHDIRNNAYISRFSGLMSLLMLDSPALLWVSTSLHTEDKIGTYEEVKSCGGEGVVFKEIDAPFSPGRPNSGGPHLKFKFVESASFIVTGHNTKRSVALCLFDGDDLVSAGNVTIPANHEIPPIGNVVEVRYLYAFRESGSIFQPVYQGQRRDILTSDCVVEQLKYKAQAEAA